MKPTRKILFCSIATAVFTLPAYAANTTGTFDSPGGTDTFGTLQKTGDPVNSGPTIEVGGPTGSFLRLTHDQTGQTNHYAFDGTHGADWNTFVGQFDFRIGAAGDPADGLAFLLIPQATNGSTGNGWTNFPAGVEEPNVPGTLALGLDMYPHGTSNDVSLHWNGQEQTNAFTAPALIDFVNSGWNQARVTYAQVGNGLNAKVEITKDVFGTPTTFTRLDQAIDARPYANRLQLSARTGGLSMATDVDNVSGIYTGSAAALPTINPGTHIWQDFDSLGATSYVARLHNPDGSTLKVGPKLVATGGSGGGAYMQLVPDAQNSTLSSISLNRTASGGLAPTRRLELDLRMANPDNQVPADGLGILLLPTSGFGVVGAGPAPAFENASIPGGLSIGLQMYAGSRVNRVHLNWNGVDAVIDPDMGTLDLLNGEWHRMQLDTEAVDGGSRVSLSFVRDVNGAAVNVPVFTNYFVADMAPYDYRVQVGTRTGGLNLQADVDNLRTFSKPTSHVAINNTTFQSFDGPGTYYQATDRHGFDADTDATRHAALLAGGPSGRFLRLVHAVNSQSANVGFDQVIPSGAAKPFVEADFDFRMSGDAGGNRADGFAFGLFDVNTYGTTGGILDAFHPWESQGLANALTLAFGIYDGNPATSTDFIRLLWNGNVVPIFPPENTNHSFTAFDLNSDLFHHAKLTLVDIGTDTKLSLTLTQDEFGAATDFAVFSDVIIPGMDLDTFNFRAGFGARTGGANADIDIDNVQVVPEPGSAALLLGGLALMTGRRRRR